MAVLCFENECKIAVGGDEESNFVVERYKDGIALSSLHNNTVSERHRVLVDVGGAR